MAYKLLLTGAAVVAALGVGPAAMAQPAAPPTSYVSAPEATMSSQQFVTRAAVTGIYEIEAAQIAERRSHNPAIDRFAARMIRDHGRNDAELKGVVAKIGGLRVPSHPDRQHAGLLDQLRAVRRRQFDASYAQQQVQGHQDAVATFTSYAHHGDDPRLAHFAKATLPILQHHLEMARALPAGPQVAGRR